MLNGVLVVGIILIFSSALAADPNWSEGHLVPLGGQVNPYQLDEPDWISANQAGRLHAQIYPVEITGLLPPYRAIKNLIEDQDKNIFRRWISRFTQGVSKIKSFDDVERTLGLHPYPLETDQGVYAVPYPNGVRPASRLGMGLIERHGAEGFTFSCAACHSASLFGKTILGMTNRFPRANEFFVQAKRGIRAMPPNLFQQFSEATDAETTLYEKTRDNISFVKVKAPLALGLDTSLAQVALSLGLRQKSPWAEKSLAPHSVEALDWLETNPADSKPAVWWNLKYKNRWLSDGSVLSGNPIVTNILWNEIGRGVDLHDLSLWLQQNAQVIQELATAAFSSEPPLITDFFPAEMIDLEKAKAGEKVFINSCARCHGHYEKNWSSLPDNAPLIEKLKTSKVLYPQKTRVIDVGTDPYRRLGMRSLERLNDLQISKDYGVSVKAQKGYVPPPLVGIWARWPYFHNNSAPTLCDVISAAPLRNKVYWARPADQPQEDFDFNCNGYPKNLSEDKKLPQYKFDTNRKGLGNQGHDEGIFLKEGKEILSPEDKQNLIQFLQTL